MATKEYNPKDGYGQGDVVDSGGALYRAKTSIRAGTAGLGNTTYWERIDPSQATDETLQAAIPRPETPTGYTPETYPDDTGYGLPRETLAGEGGNVEDDFWNFLGEEDPFAYVPPLTSETQAYLDWESTASRDRFSDEYSLQRFPGQGPKRPHVLFQQD